MPEVLEFSLTLKPPTQIAQLLSGCCAQVMFLPILGPNTDTKAGFDNALISDHEKFIASITKNPETAKVGVKPIP